MSRLNLFSGHLGFTLRVLNETKVCPKTAERERDEFSATPPVGRSGPTSHQPAVHLPSYPLSGVYLLYVDHFREFQSQVQKLVSFTLRRRQLNPLIQWRIGINLFVFFILVIIVDCFWCPVPALIDLSIWSLNHLILTFWACNAPFNINIDSFAFLFGGIVMVGLCSDATASLI